MVVDVMLNKVFTETSEDNTVLQESACSLCKSASVIADTESGEIICSICGMVISDKIREARPESRRFLNSAEVSNKRSGTGMPTSLAFSDMGLSTVIGNTDRDASGYKIEPSVLSTMHRLRTWDFRTQVRTSADRNFRLAFTKLDMLKDKLGLSDSIIEKAAYIYRKAQQRNLARGRSVSIILTAATYIACREAGIPKTLKEIAFANNINRKLVAKAYRVITSELGVKPPTCDPMKCVVKVANKATIDEKTKRQAIKMMDDVTKKEISAGKDPMGLAATVLYISCIRTGQNITQKDIAQAAGITEVTLRNRFRDLMYKLELN